MFTTFFSFSLLLGLVLPVLSQSDFTIDTPAFVQCQSAQITWSNTSYPPYDLLIVHAEDPCGPALEDLGNQTSTSLNWTVNIAAGTQVALSLLDTNGDEAWSGTITVGSSSDTSCLTSTPPQSTSESHSTSATSTSTHSPTPSTTYAPAGAAGSGVLHQSGTLSTRPLSIVPLLGSAVLAVVALTA